MCKCVSCVRACVRAHTRRVQQLWISLVSDHGADGGIWQVELPGDVGRVRLHRHRQNNIDENMFFKFMTQHVCIEVGGAEKVEHGASWPTFWFSISVTLLTYCRKKFEFQ